MQYMITHNFQEEIFYEVFQEDRLLLGGCAVLEIIRGYSFVCQHHLYNLH